MLFGAKQLGEIVIGHLSRKPHWLQSLGEGRELTLCSPAWCYLPRGPGRQVGFAEWGCPSGNLVQDQVHPPEISSVANQRHRCKRNHSQIWQWDGFPWVLNYDYKVTSLPYSFILFLQCLRLGFWSNSEWEAQPTGEADRCLFHTLSPAQDQAVFPLALLAPPMCQDPHGRPHVVNPHRSIWRLALMSLFVLMRTLQPRQVTFFAQGHTANKWEGQDASPGPSETKSTVVLSQPQRLLVISTESRLGARPSTMTKSEESVSPLGWSLATFKVHLHVQDCLVKQHRMVERVEANVQQQDNYAQTHTHTRTHTHAHWLSS